MFLLLLQAVSFPAFADAVSPSANDNLGSLTVNGGVLYPTFSSEHTNYLIAADSPTGEITIKGVPEAIGATVRVGDIKGNMRASMASRIMMSPDGSVEFRINPSPDFLYFRLQVTSVNGNSKNYMIKLVNEMPAPVQLRNLTISEGTLSPEFDSGELSYTTTVANEVSAITVTGFADDAKASVTVNGKSASEEVALVDKETEIEVVVTAEFETDQKTYTVWVTREAKKQLGRIRPLVSERTVGGQTIARFEDMKFGLIAQKDESGLFDYLVPLRTKANDIRLLIPYADVIVKAAEDAGDLVLNYQDHEIRIPMAVFEGDWFADMPVQTEATFEIHLLVDEAGQTTYSIDFFVVEQVNEKIRRVHRRTVQK